MYWLRTWAAARVLGLNDSWELTPWELSACFQAHQDRETRMDARFAALMFVEACLTGKRTDGQPWRISMFADQLLFTHQVLTGQTIENDEPGRPKLEDLEKLAKAAGMKAGDLSADEWAKIQQAERERLAKIPVH